MTREEAKEELIQSLTDNHIPDPEAVEMAIKALEQEPCEDAISRQAVINIIDSWLSCDGYNEAERHIMRAVQSKLYDLPPVNPQPCEDAILRQAVLDIVDSYSESRSNVEDVTQDIISDIVVLPPVTPGSTFCDVAISKQAAINAVNIGNLNPGIVEALQSILAELPPVTPQPKMGKWIKSRDSYGNNHFTCPFCEHDIATKYVGIWEDNYCSNCGAKMEEVKE